MLFISVEDFYEQVHSFPFLNRQEETTCAGLMKEGDLSARERLIQSYLHVVASYVRQAPEDAQCLGLVLYYQNALERAVDSFNFLQDNEPFMNHLSWVLRQAYASYRAR